MENEAARACCIRCGRLLMGAAMLLCAACMPAVPAAAPARHHDAVIAAGRAGPGAPAPAGHDGAVIGVAVADRDRAEPPHVPEPGAADIHEGTGKAASPPGAAAPFIRPRISRGRPPLRMTGRSQGTLVFLNPDGTSRIVYVRG